MAFLNGRESGDTGHDGDGNNRPECQGDGKEEQQTGGPEESEDSYYVRDVFHPSRFFFACGLCCQMAPTLEHVSFSGQVPHVSKPLFNAH